MIAGTGLKQNAAFMISDAESFLTNINEVMQKEFTGQDLSERRTLVAHFDNQKNAQQLISAVFNKSL
jgi:hypothetical protein